MRTAALTKCFRINALARFIYNGGPVAQPGHDFCGAIEHLTFTDDGRNQVVAGSKLKLRFNHWEKQGFYECPVRPVIFHPIYGRGW